MYLERVRHLTQKFEIFKLSHVPREQTSRAELLAKLAAPNDQGIIDQ